jgi:hypothetical protein
MPGDVFSVIGTGGCMALLERVLASNALLQCRKIMLIETAIESAVRVLCAATKDNYCGKGRIRQY